MEYLEKYGVTKEEIDKLKERFNEGIIEFLTNNEIFIEQTIEYLYSQGIKCIYLLMINNIQIFLETKVALQEKVDMLKEQGISRKEIQLKLLQGD